MAKSCISCYTLVNHSFYAYHRERENTMAKTSAKRQDRRPAARSKAAQPKDLPEAACIVCGSEAWCDCEWDHFYGETVEAQAQEKEAQTV